MQRNKSGENIVYMCDTTCIFLSSFHYSTINMHQKSKWNVAVACCNCYFSRFESKTIIYEIDSFICIAGACVAVIVATIWLINTVFSHEFHFIHHLKSYTLLTSILLFHFFHFCYIFLSSTSCVFSFLRFVIFFVYITLLFTVFLCCFFFLFISISFCFINFVLTCILLCGGCCHFWCSRIYIIRTKKTFLPRNFFSSRINKFFYFTIASKIVALLIMMIMTVA